MTTVVIFYFLIMSPDIFSLHSGLYLGKNMEYFNGTLQDYPTGQCKVSHARMKTLLSSFSNYLP